MPQLVTPGNMRGGAGQRQQPPAQIIDVGKEPGLKNAFLSGRISNLAAPFIYHDPGKDIAYILMPMEMNLRTEDQQRAIGMLTQNVMRGMPNESKRAYLLQPKTFFTMQSLMEAILEKDGVTPEMLKAQQEKSDLLRDLVRMNDEPTIRETVRKNDEKIDAAIFEMLGLNLDSAAQANREDIYNKLISLEKVLVEESTYGKKVGIRAKAIETLQKTPTRETLLQQLTESDDAETREYLITVGRQLLDYTFFQQLSTRIDAAADEVTRAKLIGLRKEVQDTRVKIEQSQREFMQEKAQLINTIITSDKPMETAVANERMIDEAFLQVVDANIKQATQQAQGADLIKALGGVREIAMQIMAQRQPPEMQIINSLLQVKYPDETRAMLEELKEMTDDRFLKVMGQMAEQLAQQDRTDLSAKLTQIMIQAREILPKYTPELEAARVKKLESLEDEVDGTPAGSGDVPAAPVTPAAPEKKRSRSSEGILLGGGAPPVPPAGKIEIARR